MNHDDLADGTGKAAVTVQTKNQLGTAGYMNSSAYENLDGYLWSKSPRRTWCNNKFKSALPDWIQTLIKSTTKLSNRHATTDYSASLYRGQTTTTDEVFLLSEFETFGSAPYSGSAYGDVGSDGTQYEYMKVKGVVQGVEKWYDNDVESELSNKEIIESVNSLGETYIELTERKPIIEIQKSNVIDDNGDKVKLDIYEDPQENPEACYKLEVDGRKNKFKILIGKDGSIQIEGNVVKVKCNDLDLTESRNIGYSSLNFIER